MQCGKEREETALNGVSSLSLENKAFFKEVFMEHKKRGAALITVALVALIVLFGMTACPNNAGGGGGTPSLSPADKTYTVDGVNFTIKGIAAVTNGNVGHSDYSNPSSGGKNAPHTVSLSAYLIGETEVTQELYQAVMSNKPSSFNDNPESGEEQTKRPVERVSWYDCIAFCNKLSLKLGLEQCYTVTVGGNPIDFSTLAYNAIPAIDNADWNNTAFDGSKNGFRLPTEAEWEWAAKGGTDDKWAGTDTKSKLKNYAWYNANSGSKTHEVKKKKQPNGYDLYNMSGNVQEWCWDWYSASTPASGQTDPIGVEDGTFRIIRGGSWYDNEDKAACAYRNGNKPFDTSTSRGFRVVCRP